MRLSRKGILIAFIGGILGSMTLKQISERQTFLKTTNNMNQNMSFQHSDDEMKQTLKQMLDELKQLKQQIQLLQQQKGAEDILVQPTKKIDDQKIRIVQIGANDGSIAGNDALVRSILSYNQTDAILVEPNPQVFDLLTQNIENQYSTNSGIRGVNALVCNSNKLVSNVDGLTFYLINITMLLEDYPSAPHWVKYQISSLEYESISRGAGAFVQNNRRRSVNKDNNRTAADYIYPTKMTCQSYQDLLNGSGWLQVAQQQSAHQNLKKKRVVDVVAIDTEGYDSEVIRDIVLNTPRSLTLLPRIIVFEQKGLKNDDLVDILQLLYKSGYTTDCDSQYQESLQKFNNQINDVKEFPRVSCNGDDVVSTLSLSSDRRKNKNIINNTTNDEGNDRNDDYVSDNDNNEDDLFSKWLVDRFVTRRRKIRKFRILRRKYNTMKQAINSPGKLSAN